MLLAGAAVLLAACGSGGSSSSAATTPPQGPDTTAAAPTSTSSSTSTITLHPAPTSRQLAGELLTVSDMPTGWPSQPVSNSSGGASTNCNVSAFLHKTATGHAEADFADGSLPTLDELIGGYRGAPTAAFGKLVTQLGQCTTLNDQGHKFTLGRMSFPTIGTESAAYSATGSIQGINVGLDFVFARKGDQILVMLYGDIGSPDVTQFVAFAKKAAAKMPA